MKISFTINDIPKTIDASPETRARDLLSSLGFISLRNGCDSHGTCGMCTILYNGRTVNSCLLLAPQLEGSSLYTVDYFSKNRRLSVLQQAMVDAGIVQCGYCTPAMVLALENLLKNNPEPSRPEITDALSGILCRCTGYEQIFEAVRLARRRLSNPDSGLLPDIPEFRQDLAVVGKNRGKVDGAKLVRGEKAFVEDFVDSGSYHLLMLRSPLAHAYIKELDVSEAEALPGVAAVITHKNCPDIYYNQAGQGFPEPSPYDRKMFEPKVRHIGDRVAAVIAESPETARKAMSLIKVSYEPLEPVLNYEDAVKPGAPLIHGGPFETAGKGPDPNSPKNPDPREGKILYQFPIGSDPQKNLAASVEGGIGNIEEGLAQAEKIITREYSAAQVQCTPLEPHVAYAKMEGDRVVIHASTQVPWHVRRITAYVLGLKENQVRVIKERVGGGFGAKQDIVLEEVCAYAAYITGKPVLFRMTREEEFTASRTRHPMKIKVTLGTKNNGLLTAVLMEVFANTGPFGSHCLTVPMNACSKSLPLFLCPNVRFNVKSAYTNIPPAGAYQGYGAPQGSFALQTAMAELAEELGMDQMELIEKNRVREGSVLEILRCLGEGREGTPQKVITCGLGPALQEGSKLIEWGKNETSGNSDIAIGKGFAIIQQGSGLPGLDASNTDIKMLWDGTFLVKNGGADLGTGLDTVVAKVAAETLKVPLSSITVLSGDTDTTPFDTGAYASSGTFFSGNATIKAARLMEKEIIKTASEILKQPQDKLSLAQNGIVKGGARDLPFSEIAAYTQSGTGRGELTVSAGFTTEEAAFPYGAHFCQVAVNRNTGELTVQKYYALQDCGTPINPELSLGQIYGGVMKSIGHSLYEEMIIDSEGRCLNPNFLDYKIPGIADLPKDFRAILVETNDPEGPYGGKSVSEISTNGAAPALAVAIHDALGVWIREWPFTPERILRALGKIH